MLSLNNGSGCLIKDEQQLTVHEAKILGLDISKAKYHLNWYPKWNINKTIEKTAEWYKNYKKTDVYSLCVDQLNDYRKS